MFYEGANLIMARFKLYYTADEITPNLYTSGKELMTISNQEYIGLYHTYITGEVYSQPIYDPKTSVKLIAYKDISNVENKINNTYSNIKPNLFLKFIQPKTSFPKISKQDIQNGYVTRYIIQQINNAENILEIDQQQYDLYKSKKIDSNRYFVEIIKWRITGNIDDTKTNGIESIGVRTANQKQINYLQTKMANIQKILVDPLQYYVDNSFISVIDINGLE